MERLGSEYDLESRRSTFSAHQSAAIANRALPSICKCGIVLFLKRVVFLNDPLYCCSAVVE